MFLQRRTLLALSLCMAASAPALAQDKFPSKTVTIIVPQAAGGANDTIARVIAQKLSEQTGQSFVVENRTGAGGNVGTAAAAKTRPDGYTLLLTADSAMVINPALYKNTGFDPVKDFEPVSSVATAGYVLVAHPNFPARNTAELVALAKQQPGKINIGSAGNGTLNHLIGEMLGKATGIDLTHVPYKGPADVVRAIGAGEVQMSLASAATWTGLIRAGRARALAVTRSERLPLLPEVPTLREAGFPDIDPRPWFGLFASAGTPRAIVARIQKDVAAVINDAEFREREITGKGYGAVGSTPEEFAAFLKIDLEYKGRLIRVSGAKAE